MDRETLFVRNICTNWTKDVVCWMFMHLLFLSIVFVISLSVTRPFYKKKILT